jgi:hypothetical protein
MVTCLPTSICSWNYRVLGLPAGEGTTEINWFSEQGRLSLGGATYEVVKHGPMSGEWTLENRGEIVATARKPSMLTRTAIVTFGEATLTVHAVSPFSRVFELLVGERDVHRAAARVVGRVRPVHPFTRRGVMECDAAVPQLVQMFVFWLVAMSWRRTASKNNG